MIKEQTTLTGKGVSLKDIQINSNGALSTTFSAILKTKNAKKQIDALKKFSSYKWCKL